MSLLTPFRLPLIIRTVLTNTYIYIYTYNIHKTKNPSSLRASYASSYKGAMKVFYLSSDLSSLLGWLYLHLNKSLVIRQTNKYS